MKENLTENREPIENIVMEFYKNIKDEIISKSRVHFHDLANRIGVVLAHEMVHLRQYHMIGGNINDAQKN